MSASRRKICLYGLFALLCMTPAAGPPSLGQAPPATGPAPLFSPAGPELRSSPAGRPEVLRSRRVEVDAAAAVESRVVLLNLFPDVVLIAERTRIERVLADGEVWFGELGGGVGSAVLSRVGETLVGNVRVGSRVYEIRYDGGGYHRIQEVDAGAFPPELCEAEPSQPESAPTKAESVTPPGIGADGPGIDSDPCDLIDIMVVYTPAAKKSNGGEAAMKALIYLAVAETNESYRISGVTPRVNLVHIDEVSYTESGDLAKDRDRLRATADGYMDNVHTLRERYCADATSLIVDIGGKYCGYAYVQDPAPRAAFASSAFDVVVDSCATGYFSFGHELGHLMGARHDWFVDATTTPYTHSHGFVNLADNWRTIMAYNNRCKASNKNCTRLGRWSNAGLTVGGDATGVATGTSTACTVNNTKNPDCDAENFRALNATACTVARFRDRSTCVDRNDVWIKDTWDDTGAEPDPLTAGQAMWQSPSIWVRHNADTHRVAQHQHENPLQGQTNYVYTKLHNDFASSASGHLKLYYAAASTGLSWPTDWTLFSDETVSIDANDTLVAETTWTPPNPGHYCLLARWDAPTNPSDPMTHPEVASVESNTRNNNNIAWRNVNVKQMNSGDAADVAPAIVRNVEEAPRTIDLLVRLEDVPLNFIRSSGDVVLDLGPLYEIWHQGGALGRGIIDLGGGRVQILDTPDAVAELNGFALGPRESGEVFFSLTAPVVDQSPVLPPDGDEGLAQRVCSTPALSIPDNDPAGAVDMLPVEACEPIENLDLYLRISHSYVGDLSVRLEHVAGASVLPVDRPGEPASPNGCAGDDIDALLDDEASFPAESACAGVPPAVGGVLIPGDPPDPTLFEAFRGEDLCGDWELSVVDHAAGDLGVIEEWCLVNGPDPVAQSAVTTYRLELVQRDVETGQEVGGVAYDVQVTPDGIVGAVPDGAGRPGTPLTVLKKATGELLLSWGETCLDPQAIGTDYVVYEGSLGAIGSHTPERCTNQGLTFATLTPSTGNTYYLIVPRNQDAEGSHGRDGYGSERPTGALTCLPQRAGGC